jgi:hypothetical protein
VDNRDGVHLTEKGVEMRRSKLLLRVEPTLSIVKFPRTTSTRVMLANTNPLDEALYSEAT